MFDSCDDIGNRIGVFIVDFQLYRFPKMSFDLQLRKTVNSVGEFAAFISGLSKVFSGGTMLAYNWIRADARI